MLGWLGALRQGDGAEEVSLMVNESEVREREELRRLGPMQGVERALIAVDSEH
jgi:hypothetical protein